MRVTYLSMDPLSSGVGYSQVLRYVLGLASRGVDLRLHTFEHEVDATVDARLREAGIDWSPHRFGSSGQRGGALRIARAAAATAGAGVLHARGDLAAAAALLSGTRTWVWDMRAFWREQRVQLGMISEGSLSDRIFRVVESRSAASASAIIVLADAAVPVLESRHGPGVAQKTSVVPTAVDLTAFAPSPLPALRPVRLLLSGTINAYYDVPTMIRFVERSQGLSGTTHLEVLTPDVGRLSDALENAAEAIGSVPPELMPERIRRVHAGLSVCRNDAGASLTAAMPTKVGEFLAAGRPVVVNSGLGDLDELLRDYQCGVVLTGTDDDAIDAGVAELQSLLDDAELPARCRSLAEAHFSLDDAVERVVSIYRSLT